MKLRTVIATATTAAILATSGVALAGATTGTTEAPTAKSSVSTAAADRRAAPGVKARRLRVRHVLKNARGIVCKTIGIDRRTLRKGLRDGLTIAQIAEAHNVAPQTVIDALEAAAHKKLDAALASGRITEARAAKIEQRISTRITKLVNSWHPKRLRDHATP